MDMFQRLGDLALVELKLIKGEPLRMLAILADGFHIEQEEQSTDSVVVRLLFVAQIGIVLIYCDTHNHDFIHA